MKKQIISLLAVAVLGLFQVAKADVTFGQDPSGGFWQPLSPDEGTYVYATSFVAQSSGDVSSLGAWLRTVTYDASTTMLLQILGSASGNPALGPTVSTVFASTAPISGMSGDTAFYSGAVTSYDALVAGETYWFALNVIGSAGFGEYQVASATDSLSDGGSFWYSNDSAGVAFDGRGVQPELAFSVTVADGSTPRVPDAGSSLLMLFSAVAGLVAVRRKLAAN